VLGATRDDAESYRFRVWAPRAKRVELHLCDIHTIRDGRIHATHAYFDAASMMGQLGLMPEMPSAAHA